MFLLVSKIKTLRILLNVVHRDVLKNVGTRESIGLHNHSTLLNMLLAGSWLKSS